MTTSAHASHAGTTIVRALTTAMRVRYHQREKGRVHRGRGENVRLT